LDPDELDKLCELAKLEVSPDEVHDSLAKLSGIVEFVDQLKAVDTTTVSPMAHPMDLPQRLRADEVAERDQHARYQANAPLVERGLYLVPKVIE
jgi:aspartyl-tRNA(Asn)/glutamyl-tRNA(Gln) amidotransferase subunit C